MTSPVLDAVLTPLQSPVIWPLIAIAFATGLVRGFAGFGAAMVFVPLASGYISPREASTLLLLIDAATTLPLLAATYHQAEIRSMGPLAIGAIFMVPVGAYILAVADPITLRWTISILILIAIAILASGWRYHGPERWWLSLGVGGTSGIMSGIAQLTGPALIIYWLGRGKMPVTIRANIVAFFTLTTVMGAVSYGWNGFFTQDVLLKSLWLVPSYGLGIIIGSIVFPYAPAKTFRQLAYLLIVTVAITSMPVFD